MGFMRSAERFPERPAVIVQGTSLSYRQLRETAIRIAASIQAHQGDSWTPLTAVFAHRSPTAFTGVLGALLAGNGYVPLNRTFPVTRTRLMFERSQRRSIIIDAGSSPQLDALLDRDNGQLLLIAPDLEDPRCYRERWPQHIFVGSGDLEGYAAWREPTSGWDAIAYLLFTSGSTGAPKGVMVAHRNVTSFVDYIADRLEVTGAGSLCVLSFTKDIDQSGTIHSRPWADNLVLGTLDGFTYEAIGSAEAGRFPIPQTEPVLW
jgi:non-ribosomal peptide synthetase component F